MAPHASEVEAPHSIPAVPDNIKQSLSVEASTQSRLSGPLTSSGSLDNYDQFDVTAVIGREFPKLQLSEILNDDNKVRDLAILGEYLSSHTKSS